MCKLMAFTNVSKLKTKELVKVLFNVNVEMRSEGDGFGWVASTQNGLVGERYLDPEEFDMRITNKVKIPHKVFKEKSAIIGNMGKLSGALLIHGRTSTNSVNINNTHPFIMNDWALVHNGVVYDDGPKYNKKTNCDTEDLLYRFVTGGMAAVEKHLTGYYAFGAIAPGGTLHVVRDDRAGLYCAYIETIDSMVFATVPGLIESVCTEMKWRVSAIEECLDNFHAVYNGNELIDLQGISPKKYTANALLEEQARKAFGYQYDDMDYPSYYPTSINDKKIEDIDWKKYEDSKGPGSSYEVPNHDIVDEKGVIVDLDECEIFMRDGIEIRPEDYLRLPREEQRNAEIYMPSGKRVKPSFFSERKAS